MVMTAMKPSTYQVDVIRAIQSGDRNIVVQARAGAGKTTLLKMVAQELVDQGKQCLFVAFVKRVADELKAKLPKGVRCQTINSYGHQVLLQNLGNVTLDKNKGYGLAYPHKKAAINAGLIQNGKIKQLKAVYDYCRTTLTPAEPEALKLMVDDYGLDLPFYKAESQWETLAELVTAMLQAGLELAANEKVIDFNDQIYLPLIWADQFVFPTYDWVAIDEAQDQSEAKLQLLAHAMHKDSRLIAVGDQAQAVFLFAGARCDSMNQIVERFKGVEYPLPICYRCPRSHVELAQAFVPDIQPAENAVEGIIRESDGVNFITDVEPGDLVICRKSAPLIRLCLDLITTHKKAVVKGDDNLVNVLTAIIDDIDSRLVRSGAKYSAFLDHARQYYRDRVEALMKEPDADDRIAKLQDNCEAVKVIFEAFDVNSCTGLKAKLETLFEDDGKAIALMTIHKAKGAEAERVFILHLNPKDIAVTHPNTTAEQLEQEQNLAYVAVTRSKRELIFVAGY